jgi:sigma-B regulation protein RsbU (phosphoserine phosphatase)
VPSAALKQARTGTARALARAQGTGTGTATAMANSAIFQARCSFHPAALLDLVPASGEATFVGAGHVDNFVLKADGVVQRLSSTGMPLGLVDPGIPYGSYEIRIEPGDCVVLYSDGVTDAQNVQDDEFGDERLRHVVRASANEPASVIVSRVFEAIDEFAGAAPQFDDITIFVIKKL